MTTLPADITEHYYSLHEHSSAANAAAIIDGFINEYTAEEAGRELWLLFSGAITSEHLPFSDIAQERKCILHFYEYMKALLAATYALKGEVAG
jgi:hypothetical protein